jgi:hypothetical protein
MIFGIKHLNENNFVINHISTYKVSKKYLRYATDS